MGEVGGREEMGRKNFGGPLSRSFAELKLNLLA